MTCFRKWIWHNQKQNIQIFLRKIILYFKGGLGVCTRVGQRKQTVSPALLNVLHKKSV